MVDYYYGSITGSGREAEETVIAKNQAVEI